MHRDNERYLICLCWLMSQLKGLVLPLAQWIVCRLVNTDLWRSCRGVGNTRLFLCVFAGTSAASRLSVSSVSCDGREAV